MKLELKKQVTKTLTIKENGRSSNIVAPNFILGCNAGCSESYCVEKGTLISTKNDQILVEKIENGVFVQSLNNLTEQVELNEAYRIFQRESNSWIEAEKYLWNPSIQEEKISQYGGNNLRYNWKLKNEYIFQFKQIFSKYFNLNQIRYIF